MWTFARLVPELMCESVLAGFVGFCCCCSVCVSCCVVVDFLVFFFLFFFFWSLLFLCFGFVPGLFVYLFDFFFLSVLVRCKKVDREEK